MTKSNFLLSSAALLLATISAQALASDASKDQLANSYITDQAASHGIKSAWYGSATTRYAHAVLGDGIEAGSLHAKTADGRTLSVTLETAQVFEDIQPRLADLDGDGQHEIITIRSHNQKGAQIAVYGVKKSSPNTLSIIATTHYIGQSYRWLAPIGIADFDNDGAMDIAYIDRPHLAKILRVWRFSHGKLTQVAQTAGLTNHGIGHDYMTGGVQTCAGQSAMITVNKDWSQIVKTVYANGKLTSQTIGPYTGRESATAALRCNWLSLSLLPVDIWQ